MLEKLKRFNWLMFVAMLALVALGTAAIYSAGNARTEEVFHSMWKANLSTAVFGLAIYFVLAFFDYRRYLNLLAAPSYLFSLVLLVTVLFVGTSTYGGRRWLWFFQPSEVAKLCVIAALAWIYGYADERPWLRKFYGFLVALAVIGVPALLILLEPDLGTMLALLPATLVMLFVARVWRRGILTVACIAAIVVSAVLAAVYEAERPGVTEARKAAILKFVPLRPHQVKRVKIFGGFSGKGFRKGETNHLKYLPQSISMNDFIFCVYAEEAGFVGSVVLLALFGTLLVPCVWTAYVAADGRGRLVSIGVSTLVFAHVFINIAMSIGLVPITGLPLPFISAGRTFLVTVMAGLGIVQSVSIHRRENDR